MRQGLVGRTIGKAALSMDGENQYSAVLLDQQPLWLEAIEHVMQRIGVDVVGKTSSFPHALELIDRARPDLLVTGIDLDGPGLDGLECVRRARESLPQLRVVVLSTGNDPDTIEAVLDAGASAYVVKSAHPDDLAAAVRQAFQHSIYLAGSRGGRMSVATAMSADAPELTRREREILRLVAEGHSNAKLAKMLWVTEQTVKFHLSNIYRKLNVSNRTGAARWAQVHGLLSDSQPQDSLVA